MPKRSSKDENQLARSVVDEIIAETETDKPEKNPAAVALGRLGGLKGGKASAAQMTKDELVERARMPLKLGGRTAQELSSQASCLSIRPEVFCIQVTTKSRGKASINRLED